MHNVLLFRDDFNGHPSLSASMQASLHLKACCAEHPPPKERNKFRAINNQSNAYADSDAVIPLLYRPRVTVINQANGPHSAGTCSGQGTGQSSGLRRQAICSGPQHRVTGAGHGNSPTQRDTGPICDLRLAIFGWRFAVCGFAICDCRLPICVLRVAVWDWRFAICAIGSLRLAFCDWPFAIGGFAICDWRLALSGFMIYDCRLAFCDWLLAIGGLLFAICSFQLSHHRTTTVGHRCWPPYCPQSYFILALRSMRATLV